MVEEEIENIEDKVEENVEPIEVKVLEEKKEVELEPEQLQDKEYDDLVMTNEGIEEFEKENG